jgi:hypothetical protein
MPNANDAMINLYENHTTNKLLYSVALEDYITRHPDYEIEEKKEQTIYITYQIGISGQITIWPKPWYVVPVTPET